MENQTIREREKIFVHYEHINKWIASCYSTEQLVCCRKAMDSFADCFVKHVAVALFYNDLDAMYRERHVTLSGMEMAYLQLLNTAA
jgi:hypothetical protein